MPVKKIASILSPVCLILIINQAQGQWVSTNALKDEKIQVFARSDSAVFAGTDSGGVFKSTDNGSIWTAVNTWLVKKKVTALAVQSGSLIAGTDGGGVLISSNNGGSWRACNNGLGNRNISSLAVTDSKIFAGTPGDGVFMSSDDCSEWSSVNNGLGNSSINALAIVGKNIVAGSDITISRSPISAIIWKTVDTSGFFLIDSMCSIISHVKICNPITVIDNRLHIKTFAVVGSIVLATTINNGILRSVDSGSTWEMPSTSITPAIFNSLSVKDNQIYLGEDHGKVLLSSNAGLSWMPLDSIPNTEITALEVSGEYLLAGTNREGIWRLHLPKIGTGSSLNKPLTQLHSILRYLPSMNSQSGIALDYTLASPGRVRIGIYSVSGKNVLSFDKGEQPAGKYRITLETAKIPSGLYVYRFQAGDFQESNQFFLR